jgi:hypothetical protein
MEQPTLPFASQGGTPFMEYIITNEVAIKFTDNTAACFLKELSPGLYNQLFSDAQRHGSMDVAFVARRLRNTLKAIQLAVNGL